MFKYAVGYFVADSFETNKLYLDAMEGVKHLLHDIHIAHYDLTEIASGRFISTKNPQSTHKFVEEAVGRDFRLSILINYLLHRDYDRIIKIFDENYYRRGIRSVVVADMELIKRLRDKYPDLYIQGSALSYLSSVSELQEERDAGVDIHNPKVGIIRHPEQIEINHQAGFKQKVMPFEGCFRECRHEKTVGGHRWNTARGTQFRDDTICSRFIFKDLRHFFRADWVTIQRLHELNDSIEVVKLPRGTNFAYAKQFQITSVLNKHGAQQANGSIDVIEMVENDAPHDVAKFNCVAYGRVLREIFFEIPSHLFDKEFFDISDSCGMKCEELKCDLCFRKAKELSKYIRDRNKFEISGVEILRK